jgi:hypothetical protein
LLLLCNGKHYGFLDFRSCQLSGVAALFSFNWALALTEQLGVRRAEARFG